MATLQERIEAMRNGKSVNEGTTSGNAGGTASIAERLEAMRNSGYQPENPTVSKYKEIAEANFAPTKKTETQPAGTKYLPALVDNEPEKKATAEVKSVIDSTMQSMSPAGLARRNQQKAEAEEQAKRDAAKSVIDASLGAMTPSGMNVVRRAQEQKAAQDAELEKTKAELEHAKDMYKTYSTLHGSGQTTAREKQTALEQMRRFESEISRLDSVINNWGKEAGPTAAGAAAIEKHQAEIKETQQTKALYEAAYNKAAEAKQRMDDFVRGKLAAGETLTAEEEAERRKIDRQYESALDNYENYAGGYVVRRARESLVDSAEGIVNELGYMGNVLNAVTLAEGGDVRAVQKAMGISNPRVDETVENYTRNVNPLVSWGDVYSELTQKLYPNPSKTQKVAGDIAAGVAGMMPSMVAQVVAPGSGIYMTMLSAAGNATKEAMEAGADDMRALAYGMAVGSTEALIEKTFNGVAGVFGKGAADDVIEEYVKSHLRNETAQQAVIKLTGALGEGFEEFATEFANRLTNEIIIDTDDRSYLETLGDAGYSFLMGMAVSGIIQTASSLGSESNPKALAQKAVENVKQQMQQAREPSKAEKLRLPTVEDIRNGRTFEPTETSTVAPLPSVEDVRKQAGTSGSADIEKARSIAEKFGASLEVKDLGAGVRGEYSNGVISIDPNTERPVMQVLVHELTHHMESSGMYEQFSDRIMGYIGEDMQVDAATLKNAIVSEYAEGGIELDDAGASRELVAKFCESKLFTDEAAINRLARTDRNLFQRIYDWIRDTIAKIGADSETRFLIDAQRMYEKALRSVGEAQNGTENLFAGEKAKNADFDALSQAQSLEAAGTDSEAIRQETGWFRGADGKWRFEIDDSGMSYERRGDLNFRERHEGYSRYRELTEKAETFMLGNSNEWLSEEEQTELTRLQGTWNGTFAKDGRVSPEALPMVNLSDYIRHEELFKNYPELKNASLVFASLPEGVKGRYSPEQNIVTISEDMRRSPESVLVHEIQHAIQEYEGFAPGSNRAYWEDVLNSGRQIYSKGMNESLDRLTQFEADPENAAAIEMSKRIEEALRADDDGTAYELALEEAEELGLMDKVMEYDELQSDFYAQKARPGNRVPSELYRDTAGEIEARDAASRRTWSDEQRREAAPDTGNEDTVFADVRALSDEYIPGDISEEETEAGVRAVAAMESVTSITGEEFAKGENDLVTQVAEFFDGLGNQVYNPQLGDVELTRRGAKDDIAHGIGRKKAAAFAAVPDVLREGRVVEFQKNWKGRGYDSAVVAAPIKIGDEPYLMGVVLERGQDTNRFYVHEVLTIANGASPFKTGASSKKGEPGGDAPSVFSLLQKISDVKNNTSQASRGSSFDELVKRSKADSRKNELEGMKRGVDELMNSWVEYATRKDPVSLSAEEREAIAASKIMTDYKESGDSLGEAGRKAWSFIKRKMIDSGEAVQRVAKATGDRYLYPYYNMARASSNAAVSMIVDAQTDVTGKKTGESLNGIFQPIMDKGAEYYDAFQSFLYHRHNVDRRSRDRSAETEEARRLWLNYRQSHPELQYYSDQQLASMAVNENSTMYEQAREYLKLLRNYSHTMKAVDEPVFGYEVSAEDSRAIAERLQREHPEFVQEAEKVYKYIDGLLRYRVDSGLITEESYQQLKRLYPHYVPTYRAGQESQYDTSRENIVEIGKTIKRAEGGESKLMPIHTALARQTYSVVREGSKNRFGQRLMDQHTSGTAASELIGEITEYEGDFNPDDFDALEDVTPKKNNTFIVNEGGKKYEMEVSPELFEGIKALSPDREETNLLVRMAAAGNNAYKQLITGMNPTFMVRNFVRDLQDAGLYSKNLAGFAANYPQALAQIAGNGEYWQQYKALGGMYSSVFDYQTGTVKKESGLKKNTIGKIEALNMAVEQAPRLAEFMATVKKGDGSLENLMEAMYNSADVTTNFGRSGTWGKWLNRYLIPFFNPAIQGTDKFIRNFTEAKGAKQWAGLITKSAALGIAPTIINSLLYDDDEEWEDIRQSDKDTNYLFKIKDGLWLKIPKGRALSMFGMTADRASQAVKGEEVDLAGFINTAASQMAPTNPLKENVMTDWFNTKLFDSDDPGETWYGSDIENQRMQGYEPGQRYDSKTDEISKWIGEKTGLSPKKINYLLQQYTGVIGDIVLPLLTPSAERDMFTAAFTIDTNYSNELGTRFYDTLDDLEFAKNSENATPADAAVYRYWNKVNGKVSDINAAIRAIESNEELSSKEKKNQTAEQYAIRNALEKSALETLESYEEAVRAHLSEYEGSEEDAADYAYLMANKEMFGAEYAIQTYNKKVYENARELVEKGLSYDTFFDYYFTGFASDDVTELQKLRAVADSDLTSYQMDTSLRLLMSENQYDGWMRAHDVITIHDYIDGLEIMKNAEGAKDANGETITNSKELKVMKGINDMDMSSEEKNALFDALGYDTQETIWNTEYEGSDYDSYFYLSESAREGYNAYCSWMEAADYSEYYKAYSGFYSDKDANGKTVKAKKEKVIEYIDDLDLTADQKSALFISFGYAMSSLEDCIWYNPIAMRSRYFPSVGK